MAQERPGDLEARESQNGQQERLANGLGWFSIGLGLAEFAAPSTMAHLIGIRDKKGHRALLRMYGLREITAGIGILSQPRQPGWMWGRVAGDVMDLAALGSAFASSKTNTARAGAATAAVLGVTALDVLCAQQLSREAEQNGAAANGAHGGAIQVTKTIIIGRSPSEVYAFWRDFTNLGKFLKQLDSVEITGDKTSHWRVNTPAGKTVEWDAEIVEDEPNKRIRWRTLPGGDIEHSGTVEFEQAPGGRGTLVRVELEYSPPGGVIGATVAKLFRTEPGQQVMDGLRAFKQVMETGEVARSDASIHTGMHAAQPSVQTATA